MQVSSLFRRLALISLFLVILYACSSGNPESNTNPVEYTSYQFEWANPIPQGNTLHDVVWAKSKYVAVGNNGTIMTSFDGLDWTFYNLPYRENFFRIYWNGDLSEYIVVGERLLQSPTATAGSWTNLDADIDDVCWDGNRYVGIGNTSSVAGYNNFLHTSDSQGQNWQSTPNPNLVNAYLIGIECNPGAAIPYVAIGRSLDANINGFIATSTNASDWTIRQQQSSFTKIKNINGTYYAIGSDNYTSTNDGVSWNPVQNLSGLMIDVADSGTDTVYIGTNLLHKKPADSTWSQQSRSNIILRGLQWNGSHFLVVGDNGEIARFTIAIDNSMTTERVVDSRPPIDFRAVSGNGKGLYLAAGTSVMSSTDGRSWIEAATFTGSAAIGLNYDSTSDRFIALAGNAIRTSQNGQQWTDLNFNDSEVRSIAWNDTRSIYVAVGRDVSQGLGLVWTSPDLDPTSTWTQQTLPMPMGVNRVEPLDITWDGSQFIIVGTPAVIYRSTSGNNWSVQRNPTDWPSGLSNVASDGNQLIMGGTGTRNGIFQSDDGGDTWNPVYDRQINGLTWTGTQFVGLQKNGYLAVSTNGLDWRSLGSPTNDTFLQSVYGENNLVLMVGSGAKIIRVVAQ